MVEGPNADFAASATGPINAPRVTWSSESPLPGETVTSQAGGN